MMRLLVFLLLFTGAAVTAQVARPGLHDSLFSTYYHQRADLFEKLPSTKDDIIFIGNSITDGGEWSEMFGDLRIKNRGISGDLSAGVLNRIHEVSKRKPGKVFLLIGTNDLARNLRPDSLLNNIFLALKIIREESPSSQLFVQSILPVNDFFGKFSGHTSKSKQVVQLNETLQKSASLKGYTYVDLHTPFSDESGRLKKELTNDGLHLNGNGYLLWKHLVYPFVYNLAYKPSLLPLPSKLSWQKGYFPLHAVRTIVVKDSALIKEGRILQQWLVEKGLPVEISSREKTGEPCIELTMGAIQAPMHEEEAYVMEVTPQKVIIKGMNARGVFYGLQTFRQLARSMVMVDACTISDWPAFQWRGYMVDVGRNYQSMTLLKEQIDAMATYKLNIFHFHATEDIAWRLQSKKYPRLTSPENMTRNKGAYYPEDELKELIRYCNDRYITFVPEIDMPGHSEAFTRTFGYSMQTDSGVYTVKNILREFVQTYQLPYLHIGGDEVKITNTSFLPEVTRLLDSLGVISIGWEPGGNLGKQTIRQLWMREGPIDNGLKYIDSRHLYINHMDPLESVVTIYHRMPGDRLSGTSNVWGATLCLWHDRKVQQEKDLVTMNPVYPAMLTFAERSWRGGGHKQWITNSSLIENSDFKVFEKRLTDHQKLYFNQPKNFNYKKQEYSNTQKSFPYISQSHLSWNLYGPFSNDGDLAKSFAPELPGFSFTLNKPTLKATGGTVVLRHWFAPLVQGVVPDPKENTTWYAHTQLWSSEEKEETFWIGFNNISRSPSTDSPLPGTWDNKKSTIWVNGSEISAPSWARAGQKGHSEIPLIDEGYEYREPAVIRLKRGWNSVLIKAPVGSFKGRDWHNPVKWMFTFAPLNYE